MDAKEKVNKLWGRIYESVSGNYQIKLTGKYMSISVNNEMPEVKRFYVSLSNN